MASIKAEVTVRPAQDLFGLWGVSNDKTAAKDIPALSAAYHRALHTEAGGVLPFFVLSRNYVKETGGFELFIGGLAEAPGLARLGLPAGPYGRVTVRPLLGLAWGPAIGRAKRYVYTRWLPGQPYRPLNLEFELHTEESVGKRPTVDLLFALADG